MKLLVHFFPIVLACVSRASEQVALTLNHKAEDPVKTDAFFIFNSVHHLLRQWGNTLSPNGFSFTRATIPINTNLYHARGDERVPQSPEWLAFDSEMSYGIMFGLCNVFMRTYRTTRSLNLINIDGNSASLTSTGTLDSQDILRFGKVQPIERRRLFDERERAEGLCAWGREFGVDGFVRLNTGFELLKCDFEDGLALVSNLNITRWERYLEKNKTIDPKVPCRKHGPSQNLTQLEMMLFEHQQYRTPHTTSLYGYHRVFDSPGRLYVNFDWVRIAAAVYSGMGESRVFLDTGAFVTAYGRHGLHISSPNTFFHRLTNLTLSVGREIQSEVADLFRYDRKSSGINWRSVTDHIVLRYGDRLPELRAYLMQGDATSIQNARLLLSSALVAYFEFDHDTATSLDSCVHAFTPQLDPSWPSSEAKILRAIEYVLHDICQTLLFVNEQFSGWPLSAQDTDAAVAISRRRVDHLMTQLDWKLWIQCKEKCALGELCVIDFWPVMNWELTASPEPRCVGPSNLRKPRNDSDTSKNPARPVAL